MSADLRLFSGQGAARLAAALISGLLLSRVSPPVGWDWLHWFTFIPVFLAIPHTDGASAPERRAERRSAFWIGYLCGGSGVFTLFFWLAQTIDLFSNIPLAVASLVVLLFALVWGLPYGLLMMAIPAIRRRFGHGWVLLFPALWVAEELLWPSLFPYYQGVGQYRNPWTWQLASVGGPYLLSWMIIASNAALASLIAEGSRRVGRAWPLAMPGLARGPWPEAGAVAALFAGMLGFGAWRYAAVEAELSQAPTVRAAILQQDITMVERLAERKSSTAFRSWVETTRPVIGQPIDLVVWPEGSVPYNPTEERVHEALAELAVTGGFHMLVGGGTIDFDPKDPEGYTAYNSCYLLDRQGEIRGRYDKMVPLPFGEYLPWPFIYLRSFIRGPGNFLAGTEPKVFTADRRTASGTEPFTFTTPICYEAILEGPMRRLMDADLLVNITNDGWFGDTAAPHQHAMLAAAFAVEFGRPMLRSAYTGISMIVEPHGRILEETAPYTDVSKVVEIRMAGFDTPYRTWGRYLPWLISLVGLGALIAAARAERDRGAGKDRGSDPGAVTPGPGAA